MSGSEPIVVVDPVTFPAGEEGRALLVRVTAPAAPAGRLPVILFSHGMMLARGQYTALVEWWARAGFVVLQPDHEDAAIDGFAPDAPPSPQPWRSRILDLRRIFGALDRVEAAVPALRGHLDRDAILAAGHSFGAHTVAALVGARVWNDRAGGFERFFEPAIRGALMMSPPGTGGADLAPDWRADGGFFTVDWNAIARPVLVIVGSMDNSKQMTVREADWRADVYYRSTVPDMCLVTLLGAGHYLGGIVDPRRTGLEDADPKRLAAVRSASLAFFRDTLAGRSPSAIGSVVAGTPFELHSR